MPVYSLGTGPGTSPNTDKLTGPHLRFQRTTRKTHLNTHTLVFLETVILVCTQLAVDSCTPPSRTSGSGGREGFTCGECPAQTYLLEDPAARVPVGCFRTWSTVFGSSNSGGAERFRDTRMKRSKRRELRHMERTEANGPNGFFWWRLFGGCEIRSTCGAIHSTRHKIFFDR